MRRGPYRALARRSLIAIALLTVAGCAAVDRYSGRAVVYNIEAEQAQEQALLLNIVRASLRRPMQFTTVSSITGSATASSSINYASPLHVPFRSPVTSGFPPVPSWGISGAMSGGPTFTVPVLDTAEFYDGILKPLTAQIWDLYLQNTYPRDLMLQLMVQKFVIRRLDGCGPADHERDCELTLHNYVNEDAEVELFQIFSDYLLALGLAPQLEKKPESPLLPRATNVNLNVRAPAGLLGGSASTTPSAGGGGGGEAQKASLCFAPRTRDDRRCIIPASLCNAADKGAKGTKGTKGTKAANVPSFVSSVAGMRRSCDYKGDHVGYEVLMQEATRKGPGSQAGVIMSGEVVTDMQDALARIIDEKIANGGDHVGDLQTLRGDLEHFRTRPVLVSVYTRSIEGIIYYLGEVTRRQLAPEYGTSARTIYYNYPARTAVRYPERVCVNYMEPDPGAPPVPGRPKCNPIILIHKNVVQVPGAFVATYYDGAVYSVDDRSGPVLEIVKQALAMQSSSKSLPQSNVVTLAGGGQ